MYKLISCFCFQALTMISSTRDRFRVSNRLLDEWINNTSLKMMKIDENLSYAFINKFRTLRKSKELISMLDAYIEMYPDRMRALQDALYNRAR